MDMYLMVHSSNAYPFFLFDFNFIYVKKILLRENHDKISPKKDWLKIFRQLLLCFKMEKEIWYIFSYFQVLWMILVVIMRLKVVIINQSLLYFCQTVLRNIEVCLLYQCIAQE